MTARTATPIAYAAKIGLLILAYVIAGRIAMLLATPPGFASAIFPSAGIALAAVLIWGYPLLAGVLAGSTLLNLTISLSTGTDWSWSMQALTMGIGLGATLQTWLGAWLVRKALNNNLALNNERDIFRMLLLGGPVACLTGATCGVSLLYAAHIIPSASYVQNWINWWVGDSIGVLIISPLMFILFAQPRDLWHSRIKTVGIPLGLSSLVVMLIFIWSSNIEQQNLSNRFQQQTQLIKTTLKFRFELYIRTLQAIERFFAASERVEPAEFSRFVAGLYQTYPGIQSLSWVALIPHQQREAFEASMVASGIADFQIRERHPAGELKIASARDHYAVITYVEPFSSNTQLSGLDVGALASRRIAFEQARDQAQAIMTSPLSLIQKQEIHKGLRLFYPVYASGSAPDSLTERRAQIRGFASCILIIDDLIQAILQAYPANSYHLQLTDITEPLRPIELYGAVRAPSAQADALAWQEEWPVAGRLLQIRVLPSASFLSSSQSLQSWAILVGGMLLASLLGGLLLSTSGRTHRIQQIVDERTLELSSILTNAVEAIISFDQRNRITSANPAASHLFCYDQTSLIGKNICTLIPAMEQERRQLLGLSQMISGQTREGRPLTLQASLSLVELHGQQTYTCMLHDISDQKRVEQLQSEFVSTVSHELRTPLTSINGSLGLLANGVMGELPKEAHQLINIAIHNCERLISLVGDILDIDKLEACQVSFQLQQCDLYNLLSQAIEQNTGYAERFGVQLELDSAPLQDQTILIATDPQRFQQIMANLLSNAIKFSPTQGLVSVSVELAPHSVKILVEDHGPGIPDNFRERIFHKFAQADGTDSRQRGGTGLGLSISKTLVERMNGYISYYSQAGEGSTFYIVFPRLA